MTLWALFAVILQSAEAKRHFAKIFTIVKCDYEVSHFARTKRNFEMFLLRGGIHSQILYWKIYTIRTNSLVTKTKKTGTRWLSTAFSITFMLVKSILIMHTSSGSGLTRESQRNVVNVGWPIAPCMSDRLGKKRQSTGYHWLCTAVRMEPNLTLMIWLRIFKGTVSRDFLLLVFFINQFPPSPIVSHLDCFEFFRKFAEIFEDQGWKMKMKKIFNRENFNNFVGTPLDSRGYTYTHFCLQVQFKVPAAWYYSHCLPPVSATPVANLPPALLIPVAICHRWRWHRRQICLRYRWHRWKICHRYQQH